MQTFNSFTEFYPFYLSEHKNTICKKLHFIGTGGVISLIFFATYSSNLQLLYYAPLLGYGFAWIGHFVFEKNRPATFNHPFYSLLGDFVMFKDLLFRKISF